MLLSDLFYDVIDKNVLDRIVNGFGAVSLTIGKRMRVVQSGNIGFYLLMFVLGMISIIGYLFLVK